MKKGLIVFLLAFLGLSSPAFAGYKFTATAPSGTGYATNLYNSVLPCIGYEFDTQAHADACLLAHGSVEGNYLFDGTVYYGNLSYQDNAGNCIKLVNTINNGQSTFPYYGKGSINDTGYVTVVAHASQGGSIVYLNSTSCSGTPYTQSVKIFTMSGSADNNPGANNPDSIPDVCKVPAEWNVMVSKSVTPAADGSITLPVGAIAQVTYASAIDIATYYDHNGNSVTSDGSTPPGVVRVVKFSQFGDHAVCYFRQDKTLVDSRANTQLVTLEVIAGASGIQSGSSNDTRQITVTAPKIQADAHHQKPLVSWGTKPDADAIARAITNWCNAQANLSNSVSTPQGCQDGSGNQIPVEADIPWSGQATPFVHPDPGNLARDNPPCAQTFDVNCAWSSGDPVTATTSKDQLDRIDPSDNYVVNNIVNNYDQTTIYPPAMVNAGNAPNNGTPSGNVPSTASGGSGGTGTGTTTAPPGATTGSTDGSVDGSGIGQCVSSNLENCRPSDATGDALTASSGVKGAWAKNVGDPDSWASDVFSQAQAHGVCNTASVSDACNALMSLVTVTTPAYNESADMVWYEGDIAYGVPDANGNYPLHHVVETIPSLIFKMIVAITTLVSYLWGIQIVMTGRIW